MQTIRSPWKTTLAALALACAVSAHAGVTPWEPLEIRDGHVLFPVTVAGVAGRAVFDSGSQINSVDKGFVERNGLRLFGRKFDITGVSSTEESVRSVSRLPIGLFGAEFELRDVPALPHPNMTMIIGAGFLKSSVLQLDYPNSRMRLITHDSVDLSKVANVPLRRAEGSGLPAVQVTIDGEKRWMLLDTGNSGPILMRRVVAEGAGWIGRFQKTRTTARDANADISELDLLVLPALAIGPYELADVPIEIPAPGQEIHISGFRPAGPGRFTRIKKGVRISGILGYEVLRHFIVTIDYERDKAHIEAPPEPPAP